MSTSSVHRLAGGKHCLVVGRVNTLRFDADIVPASSPERPARVRAYEGVPLCDRLLVIDLPEDCQDDLAAAAVEAFNNLCSTHSSGAAPIPTVRVEIGIPGVSRVCNVNLPDNAVQRVQSAVATRLGVSNEPTAEQICAASAVGNAVAYPQAPQVTAEFHEHYRSLQALCVCG